MCICPEKAVDIEKSLPVQALFVYSVFLMSVVYEKPGFLEKPGFSKKFLYLPKAEKRYHHFW